MLLISFGFVSDWFLISSCHASGWFLVYVWLDPICSWSAPGWFLVGFGVVLGLFLLSFAYGWFSVSSSLVSY